MINCQTQLKRNREAVGKACDDIERSEGAMQLVVKATQLDKNWSKLAFACPNTALTPMLPRWQQVLYPQHLFGILDLISAESKPQYCGFLECKVLVKPIKIFVVAATAVVAADVVVPVDAAAVAVVDAAAVAAVDVAAVDAATVLFLAAVVEFSVAAVVVFAGVAVAAVVEFVGVGVVVVLVAF